MKKNISKIILGLALAASLVCSSGCGSTRIENGVTIEQGQSYSLVLGKSLVPLRPCLISIPSTAS